MASNQNLEVLQLDPGDIAGKRFHAVDEAVDILAIARQRQKNGTTRVPRHPLVDVSETPKDIWLHAELGRDRVLPDGRFDAAGLCRLRSYQRSYLSLLFRC